MGTKLPNTKVLETYLQDLRSDRPQPTPARSLKPQESKLEQPASANASRSPDVIKAIDLDSDESPKADSVGYSPTTPAESGHGSVAPKEPPKVYTDVGPFGDFVTTDTEIPDYCDTNAPKFEKDEHHLSENVARRCLRQSLRSGIPKDNLARTWNRSLSSVDMIQNLYLNMGLYFQYVSGMIMYHVFQPYIAAVTPLC